MCVWGTTFPGCIYSLDLHKEWLLMKRISQFSEWHTGLKEKRAVDFLGVRMKVEQCTDEKGQAR